MKNEIDQTVERIGQLPDPSNRDVNWDAYKRSLSAAGLKSLANAYTQLKADLATERNEADALRAERDDLAMFVRRFLGSKFVPHCELAVKATDYLQRKGLQGSFLRDAPIKLPDLLPCPFCSSVADIAETDCECNRLGCRKIYYSAHCTNRDCIVGFVDFVDLDKSVVIKAWNTRNEADALRAEVERLTTRLAMATTFELVSNRNWALGESDQRPVVIEQRPQRDGETKWVVKMHEWVLAKDGEFIWEPLPSSRTEEFIALTRFDSVDEAIEAYAAIKPKDARRGT